MAGTTRPQSGLSIGLSLDSYDLNQIVERLAALILFEMTLFVFFAAATPARLVAAG